MLKFYLFSWFSVIAHCVAGVAGVAFHYYAMSMYQTPIELVSGDESVHILEAMWEESALKTTLLAFPFLGVNLGMIYQNTLGVIEMKLGYSE